MLSVVILRIIMLCRYSECHYAECRYSECHCSECRYAECRGALEVKSFRVIQFKIKLDYFDSQNVRSLISPVKC